MQAMCNILGVCVRERAHGTTPRSHPPPIVQQAPTFKWCITIANIADLKRPIENVSLPQQVAVTATGVLWSRYSFVITPVNYTLFSVNVFMAASGMAQLYRKAGYELPKTPIT